jgi:transcriptional regulator with XRE-family HTH domain
MQHDDTAGERLRRARKAANLSVETVAQRSGYSVSGIRAIENGQNGLRPAVAEKLAPILGTTLGYLLTGEGLMQAGEQLVPILGHVGADSDGTIIYATGQENGDLVPVPPGGSGLSRGLEVRGHSGGDFAPQGSIIYFDDQRNPPTPDMIGYPCVVATDDDRVLLKRLLKGSRQGLYDLESISGPTLSDMRLLWAALVTFVAPPHQARKIRRHASVSQVA